MYIGRLCIIFGIIGRLIQFGVLVHALFSHDLFKIVYVHDCGVWRFKFRAFRVERKFNVAG